MLLLDANSPFLNIDSPLFPIAISCVAIFATVYLSNRKIRIGMEKSNEVKLEKKANLDYVDKQDRVAHYRINKLELDTKSLEDKIDSNQKFIIERLDNMNNNILKLHSKKQ